MGFLGKNQKIFVIVEHISGKLSWHVNETSCKKIHWYWNTSSDSVSIWYTMVMVQHESMSD